MKFRIRPTMSQCRLCTQTAASSNEEPRCSECNVEVHEMLKLEKDYVYYIYKHELRKIHMDYVIVVEG